MKKLIEGITVVALLLGTCIPGFAAGQVQDVANSADVQRSETGIYFGQSSVGPTLIYNYTDQKIMGSNDMDLLFASENQVNGAKKLGNYSYVVEGNAVFKTDLKTGKKTTILNGVKIRDSYVSGNAYFVVLANKEVYRYDANGKQTALFKAASNEYGFVAGGYYFLLREDGKDSLSVNIAGEKESKTHVFGTYSDFWPREYEGRCFFKSSGTLYEVISGKAVKLVACDEYLVTKADVFYTKGPNLYKLVKGASAKLILTTDYAIKKLMSLNEKLFVLDDAKTLRSIEVSGAGAQEVKRDVVDAFTLKNKLYFSYDSDNSGVYEYTEGGEGKISKVTDADANVFVMNGKQLAYIDHLGQLHYRSDYTQKDNWVTDLNLYDPNQYKANLNDARKTRILLSNTAVYVIAQKDFMYDIEVFDLNGKKTNNFGENVSLLMKSNKTLYFENKTTGYQMDLISGTVKTVYQLKANGEFSANLNGYTIDQSENNAKDVGNAIKISKAGKTVAAISNVGRVYWIDENNVAFGNESKGWQVFNALTGKLTSMNTSYNNGVFDFTGVENMTSQDFFFMDEMTSEVKRLNLLTGEVKMLYNLDGMSYIDVREALNSGYAIVDDSGLIKFLDFSTGKLVATNIVDDHYSSLSIIHQGDRLFLYDKNLLTAVYQITARKTVHLLN